MKKQIVREYHCSDPDLLQAAEVIAVTLPDDIALFTAFYTTFTTTYPDDIVASIDIAKAVPSYLVVVQQQAERTEFLNTAQQNCTKSYHDIVYFIEKAYENDPAKQKEMGMHNYSKAVKRQSKFISFMEEFVKSVMDNKADLIHVGCKMEMLEDASKNAADLRAADTVQKKFKNTRGALTTTRILKNNQLFGLLKPVETCARNIFADDPVRLAKYILPHTEPPKPDEPVGGNPEQPNPPQT